MSSDPENFDVDTAKFKEAADQVDAEWAKFASSDFGSSFLDWFGKALAGDDDSDVGQDILHRAQYFETGEAERVEAKFLEAFGDQNPDQPS